MALGMTWRPKSARSDPEAPARGPRARTCRCPSRPGSPARIRECRTRGPRAVRAAASPRTPRSALAVDLENPEARGLLPRHRDHRHGRIGRRGAVSLLELSEVHLEELVAGQDQHVAGALAAEVAKVLTDRVGGTLEPLRAVLGLLRCQDGDEGVGEDVELVGLADVLVQALGVVLGEHEHSPQPQVEAVRDGNVDEAVLAGDGDGRLGALLGEGEEPAPAATREDHGDAVVHVGLLGVRRWC